MLCAQEAGACPCCCPSIPASACRRGVHACQHTATATPQCTHIHWDALLADGEQLKPCVRALARLGEAVNLDGQVVTLRVPEDVDVCSTPAAAGGATAAVSRCVCVRRATSRAAQSCCCCCPLTKARETRCAVLRRCLLGCCGQPERPQCPPPRSIALPGPRTADVEQLLAAHSGPVRDLGDRDVGRPVANLLGVCSQQRLSR